MTCFDDNTSLASTPSLDLLSSTPQLNNFQHTTSESSDSFRVWSSSRHGQSSSHSGRVPSTVASSIVSSSSGKRTKSRMSLGSSLNLLTTQEPSAKALEQYRQKLVQDGTLRKGRPVVIGVPGVSLAKLPPSAPQVTSRWDKPIKCQTRAAHAQNKPEKPFIRDMFARLILAASKKRRLPSRDIQDSDERSGEKSIKSTELTEHDPSILQSIYCTRPGNPSSNANPIRSATQNIIKSSLFRRLAASKDMRQIEQSDVPVESLPETVAAFEETPIPSTWTSKTLDELALADTKPIRPVIISTSAIDMVNGEHSPSSSPSTICGDVLPSSRTSPSSSSINIALNPPKELECQTSIASSFVTIPPCLTTIPLQYGHAGAALEKFIPSQ